MTQQEALSILKTGANVFLTGEPGSGKTHTIREYIQYLKNHNIEPAVTASTGIAATHIGGMTVHSWSGIGIKKHLDKYELDKIVESEYIAKRVGRARILIIDEVSMLSPETLSMVDAVCRGVKRTNEAFGGIQVIFVGDFFQLPPIVVVDRQASIEGRLFEEFPPIFAYQSSVWAKVKPMVSYLTEQHRQDDIDFLNVLSAIRRGRFDQDHRSHIEKRKIHPDQAPAAAPKLFSHNADVDAFNDKMLRTLAGEGRSFSMTSQGRTHILAGLKKGCLSPEVLELKVGAAVMFTKNNNKERFFNGTLGTVIGFDRSLGYPIVKIRDGKKIIVEPMEWTVEENGKTLASISQIPLRLAWAITIHKSQGMSLDEAVMDLSAVFEFGQGYVALSRIRRLSGLYLTGLNSRAFQVHPEVLEKDLTFRSQSDQARIVFGDLSPEETETLHGDFIRACGGTKEMIKKKHNKKQSVTI